MAIGLQYLPAEAIKFLLSPGGSPANQDTQSIAPNDGVVAVGLNPEPRACEVPPVVLTTGVSGSLVTVDPVRVCL